ncbi:MAG: AAA domain-containing protein [Methyloprofundus sp.]|nr:AAA domain-containing protein [Methyloprofundus sp.]
MTLKIQTTNLLKDLTKDDEVVLDDGIKHLFDKADLLAIWAAYQSGRPLLLRGKPGTGKSQLAKAIAHLLGWAFVSEVMHGGTQLEELHWHYDAISRLGEAQSLAYTLGLGTPDNKDKPSAGDTVQEKLDHKHFIRPGAFWWAFDWCSAKACYPKSAKVQEIMPKSPENWDAEQQGVVLLIDEIDKAEPDLPNGLLQTLGDLEFNVPYIHKNIKAKGIKPLIIITTNEERELPTALVRRCYTHTLKMAEGENKIDWLVKRGQLHFKTKISPDSYQQAAELLWQDRQSDMRYPPGLAEYLDLLRALATLSHKDQAQGLEDISQFVYNKETED